MRSSLAPLGCKQRAMLLPSVLSTVPRVQMSTWRPQWGFIPQQFTITMTGRLDNENFDSAKCFQRTRRALDFAANLQLIFQTDCHSGIALNCRVHFL